MSTGLIQYENNTDVTVQQEEDAIFKQLSSSGSFLPRFQFFSSSTEAVKSGQFTVNHYGIARGKDDVEDLGKEVDVIPCAVRFKALDLRGGEVLSYYKFASPEFQAVMALANTPDSKCMAGTEFLFWVPSVREFCTFFAYNVSSKNEAPKIRGLMNRAATMKSKYVKKTKNSFQAIVCVESSTPIGPDDLPSSELAQKTVDKFKNATDSTASAVTAVETSSVSRPQ